MIVKINDFELDTKFFCAPVINKNYRLVNFIHQPYWGGEFTFPILFDTPDEAQRFFDGYYEATFGGRRTYRLKGNAVVFPEIYSRIVLCFEANERYNKRPGI
jgi:hypothetical protein